MRVWIAALVACGGTQAPPPPVATARLALDPRPAAADSVVATVDGHPIYASCVAAQAAKSHGTREQALHDCIDFELLARAAAKRELDRDPEVVDAWHTAIASAFVDHEFERKLVRPAELPTYPDVAEKRTYRFRHGAFRGCTLMRIEVPQAADDATAHALADRIAAALADQRGLMQPDFVDTAQRVGNEAHVAIKVAPQPTVVRPHFTPEFDDALWAIPEVGRTSPAFRTQWGWDVLLLTDDVPPADATDADIVAQLVPEARRLYFPDWVDALMPSEKHPELLEDDP